MHERYEILTTFVNSRFIFSLTTRKYKNDEEKQSHEILDSRFLLKYG